MTRQDSPLSNWSTFITTQLVTVNVLRFWLVIHTLKKYHLCATAFKTFQITDRYNFGKVPCDTEHCDAVTVEVVLVFFTSSATFTATPLRPKGTDTQRADKGREKEGDNSCVSITPKNAQNLNIVIKNLVMETPKLGPLKYD